MPSNQAFAVLAATRLFTLLAVGAPALWFRDREAILAILAFALLWMYQVVAAIRRELRLGLSPTVEATVTGVICALGMESSATLLAALVVPPMAATVYAGIRTMVRTVVFQLVAVVSFGLMWWQTITSDQQVGIFTWTVAGVGLSLVANYTFADQRTADAALAPYRDAQHLISQLIELSGDLTSGLDVTALSGELLALVGDRVPHRGLVLFVPRGDALTPIASSAELDPAITEACKTAAMDTLTWGAPANAGETFAFRAGDSVIVAALLPEGGPAVTPSVDELREALAPTLVKLDTALLFTQFRDSATADERQRLAREMHDGVAQDIASLGYLVDAIAARPADEQQAAQLAALRERVSKVVAEVRQSVMNLRTSMGEHKAWARRSALSHDICPRHPAYRSGCAWTSSRPGCVTRSRPSCSGSRRRP